MVELINFFFALGVYPLYMELRTIIFPKRDFDRENRIINDMEDENVENIDRSDAISLIMDFLYLGWIGVGLLTSQWKLFAVIFILLFAKSKLNKVVKNEKYRLWIYWADAFISAIVIGFIMYNHYSIYLAL